MKINIIAVLIISILICSCKIDDNYQLKKQLNRSVPELLDEFMVSGAAIAIVEDGQIVWQKAYGTVGPDSDQAMSPETSIPCPAFEETFTALAVLKLVEQQKLKLDDLVLEVLPDLPLTGKEARFVNIGHCLSHSSGLTINPDQEDSSPAKWRAKLKDSSGGDSIFADRIPGAAFEQASINYAILQLMVETKSGTSFPDYLNKEILDPLGLTQSGYSPPGSLISYQGKNGEIQMLDEASSESTFLSSASDMSRFIEIMLGKNPASEKVISSVMLDTIKSPWPGTNGNFGLGVSTKPFNVNMILYGMKNLENPFPGFFLAAPKRENGLVVITSGANGDVVARKALCLWAEYHSGDCPRYVRKFSPLRSMQKPYSESGIEGAEAHFKILKDYYNNIYFFDPAEITDFAAQELKAGRDSKKVIDFLEFNIREYPDFELSYELLAQAYLDSGQREKALKTYEEAYYLNPARSNILDTLSRLGITLKAPEKIQVTFVLESSTVTAGDTVFISGNANELGNWESRQVPMNKVNAEKWSLTIPFYQNSRLEYKFNRGDWDTEAYNRWRASPQNNRLKVKNDTTITEKVRFWADRKDN